MSNRTNRQVCRLERDLETRIETINAVIRSFAALRLGKVTMIWRNIAIAAVLLLS
ncbi:MAG: hypothetical protein LC770_12330 [Acidobacteria bacterium]|nr:hypothetical protein [Acidobacteriota bacterium]